MIQIEPTGVVARCRTAVPPVALALLLSVTHALCAAIEPVTTAGAGTDVAPAKDAESFSIHGQFTSLTQKHPTFAAPYAGDNSLRRAEPAMETVDMTLFLGLRLWRGGAFHLDPEIEQGYGLTNTLGIAGFPSGEAYKVGSGTPYYRTQRAFLRQTFALGDRQGVVDSSANTLAGTEPEDKLTLTVGKFPVVDIFDANTLAHDPRGDFLNWAAIDSGAFDYAADSWGYTLGAALEWKASDWTLRGGYFALSTGPNVETIDTTFKQYALVTGAERRFQLAGRRGAVRLLIYGDRGHIARYDDAVALATRTSTIPSATAVRREATKSGWALNLEQELGDGVGWFARVSANDGQHEGFDFTDINRSVAAGLSVKGARWPRPEDMAGTAIVSNALSGPARAHFAAGGLGILIGDGQLPHYGTENIAEAYYSASIERHLNTALDVQSIANPAYNHDRGPVRLYGVRLHAAS